MDNLKRWNFDADRVFEIHKRILSRRGYRLIEIEDNCVYPNYELVCR